eukprot:TRINITY_DN2421_c0_g1_i2.p1 TRINITY_DN2421_c0_g1~~TRINITY_DN2421_c0_g1_i2.p1  ORF type:complete len:411 (-),score=60.65 TRINITY_DN2421_c0_g1_i2:62-1294(-)
MKTLVMLLFFLGGFLALKNEVSTVAPAVAQFPSSIAETIPPTIVPPTTLSPTTFSPLAPSTTVPPTTVPPTTVPPTTVPPTTVPPTTVSPTTVSPTTVSPTTVSPTTVPPTTVPSTDSPTTLSRIPASTLSPTTVSPDSTSTHRPPTAPSKVTPTRSISLNTSNTERPTAKNPSSVPSNTDSPSSTTYRTDSPSSTVSPSTLSPTLSYNRNASLCDCSYTEPYCKCKIILDCSEPCLNKTRVLGTINNTDILIVTPNITVDINGDFYNTGDLHLSLNESPVINVDGCASLNGGLVLDISDNPPQSNQEYEILRAPCISGEFDSITVTNQTDQCKEYTAMQEIKEDTVAILFSIKDKCDDNTIPWWAILLIVLVLVALMITSISVVAYKKAFKKQKFQQRVQLATLNTSVV